MENFDAELAAINERLEKVLALCQLGAKDVLGIDDVAMLTGLSKSHIYKLTCTHKIPYYRPNGKYLYFDKKEIEAWMKQNRHNTQLEADQMAAAYVVSVEGGAR